jgi:hypothetical protein
MFEFLRKLFAKPAPPRYKSLNMIPITPDILGPGIEEEYADALPRLDRILEILGDAKPGNDTFEARVVANCQWLRRMILERTMPIPLDRSYWGTLGYVMGDMTFAAVNPELDQKIYEVVVVVKGNGLLKPRHYPVAVALIRDLIDVMNRDLHPLSADEAAAAHELGDMIRWIEHHNAQLPLDRQAFPNVAKLGKNPKFGTATDVRAALRDMSDVIFAGGRPLECLKGPLAAPVPGLPKTPARVR